ncbi:hypothetical protein ACS3QZ_01575 [Shimia sp. W99]
MSGLKTLAKTVGLVAFLVTPANLARAQSLSGQSPLQFFAACAGRLSAEMEFQWMFDGAAADAIKLERAAVLDILDAMMPPERGRAVLNWRVEAKMAQAALLTRATFGSDTREQHHARLLAARNLETCRAQMLG